MDTVLPTRDEMFSAFSRRDPSYEGVFLAAVRTTGIFCRPTCPARKPRPANVEFFGSCRDALAAGYRPCRRCRPMEPDGSPPVWLRPLLDAVERDPSRRWSDRDLREMDLEPARVRRWFRRRFGMTFHAYSRARRLAVALERIRGGRTVGSTAFDVGYDSLSGFTEAMQRFAGVPAKRAADAATVFVDRMDTPLGPMVAAATAEHLLLLEFADRRALPGQFGALARRLGCLFAPGRTQVTEWAAGELAEYFAGTRREFTVPLLTPGTPFQADVWRTLRGIPWGETRSYSEVARALGRPTAVRAVARANGANRIAVIIPCHRVVGADGSLTGYGGGLWRKRKLLALEGR